MKALEGLEPIIAGRHVGRMTVGVDQIDEPCGHWPASASTHAAS
jgi:hypothetical protein